MATVIIQPGASSVVYLPAGWQLTALGQGIVQVAPPVPASISAVAQPIASPFASVGPFSVDVSVYVAAYASSVTCDVLDARDDDLERDEDYFSIDDAVIYAPLTKSLSSTIGANPTYFRDTSGSGLAYVKDGLGMLKRTISGEAMFSGAIRVENLCRYTERLNFNGTNGWSPVNSCTVTQPNSSANLDPQGNQTHFAITRAATTANSVLRSVGAYVLRAVSHTFSVWLKADVATTAELRVYISGGATLVTQIVNVGTTWQRFAINGTPDGVSAYVYSIAAGSWASGPAVTVYAWHPQLEEIVGTANVAPNVYVSRDMVPATEFWMGAAVDGVIYDDRENANTLDIGTGLVTEAVGNVLTTLRGVATFPTTQNLLLNNYTWPTAGTGVTFTPANTTAPDGLTSAVRMTEDISTGSHHGAATVTGTESYDGKWVTFSVFAKYAGATNGRPFVRLVFRDIDGAATKSAYFNVDAGVVGTVSDGYGEIEAYANGWYRCMWSFAIGSGAIAGEARVALCTADNVPTHTGSTSRYGWVWLPVFGAPTSPSSSDRAMPTPAFETQASANNLPGAVVVFDVKGVIGRTNFFVSSHYTPYYTVNRGDKGGGEFRYSAVTYVRSEAPAQSANGYSVYNWDRTGVTIRPNLSPVSPHKSKFAFDFYAGDFNPDFFWRPGTSYPAGSLAIPRNTLPDNQGGAKMFTAVVGGVSGGVEPTWNNTYTTPPDTTSNITTDGTVKWQANTNNGIASNWEPYLGAQVVPPATFAPVLGCSWFIADDDYGFFLQGVCAEKQTYPLTNNGKRTVLRSDPRSLHLGTMGSNNGIPPNALGATSAVEHLGVHTAFHKELRVYRKKVTQAICYLFSLA